jgi:hypothetical protein
MTIFGERIGLPFCRKRDLKRKLEKGKKILQVEFFWNQVWRKKEVFF